MDFTVTDCEHSADEQEYHLSTRRLYTVQPKPQEPLAPSGVTFPYVARTLRILLEEPEGGSEPVCTEMEQAYDDYGNQVRVVTPGGVGAEL